MRARRKQKSEPQTWDQVADYLGCTRQALVSLRRLAAAPKGKDPEEWKEFVTAGGYLKGGSRRLTEIKVLIAEEELRRRKRENAIAEGEVLSLADVQNALQRASARMSQIITYKLETDAPARLAGKEITEMRAELRGIGDELRNVWNSGLSQCTQPNQTA